MEVKRDTTTDEKRKQEKGEEGETGTRPRGGLRDIGRFGGGEGKYTLSIPSR